MIFTAENRLAVVARLEVGQSLADAVENAGLRPDTVKTWLTRGRKETGTEYAAFASDVTRARAPLDGIEPMTLDELRLVISRAARKGSVQAMRLYWLILCSEDDPDEADGPATFDALDAVDDLASRREARSEA